ncbi:MAG: T9SS type A sorting domain-containing protein [Bacteroidetes bacterium]|nr:T9SS type A sorting domain-containing protein [Bacteroidota bacterium]MBU1677498.1 T9SS type A sorting domain-containing protein [Bacteroidota bacterium]
MAQTWNQTSVSGVDMIFYEDVKIRSLTSTAQIDPRFIVYESNDSGNTWANIFSSDITKTWYGMANYGENHLWLCGYGGRIMKYSSVTSVHEDVASAQNFHHEINVYPNPFNPSTTIKASILADDHIDLNVFDINGELIKKIFDGRLKTGEYSFIWDGKNNSNEKVSSGVYFISLKTQTEHIASKVLGSILNID